ncbi:hypothetical protein Q8A73_017245 [Channa argus]|nr:hypothetical protein Q8A73_017245 [Channa argus]
MDALKSAGRAIIRSPSIAKQSWGSSRHQKLPENWTDTRETLLEGMVFQLKYLGVTMVEQPKGEELSAAAVKRIVATTKAGGKKLQKVTLKVSPRGIILYDSASNQLIENISIYRISYCTADKMHDKVFAYIVQNQHNETLECHAFLCTKRKMAQAVTLTVAQAFRVAFEFWQAAKEEKEKRVKSSSDGEGASNSQSDSSASLGSLKGGEAATGKLLDLAEGANEAIVHSGTKQNDLDPFMVHNHATENNNTVWELEDGLDEAFSRLAESRTNPQVLDIGVNPQDFNTEDLVRRMATLCMLTLLCLCGVLQFCIAQDINCIVVPDAGQITYIVNISKVPHDSDCDYSWTSPGNLVIGNNEDQNTTVVRNKSISSLILSTCFNEVSYIRRCVSEGTEYRRTCTFDCSENALLQTKINVENDGPYKWIVAVIVILLLVVIGAVCSYYRDKILKK